MGIKTNVNLRSFNSDRDELEGTTLDYVHIWSKAWHPEDENVVAFLNVVADPETHPVFVHCQHGSDRTGMMVAVYRIIVQGWTRDEAIKEMVDGGFGFHKIWRGIVKYVRNFDIEELKRESGLCESDDALTPTAQAAPASP